MIIFGAAGEVIFGPAGEPHPRGTTYKNPE